MVESVSNFPFRKLRLEKYLMLDVMMNVEYEQAVNSMFSLNKEARAFLQYNIISI